MTAEEISVAIPTRGERPILLDTIESVRRDASTFEGRVDILVVWNTSTDLPPWAAALPEDVRQIVVKESGVSRARNAALRAVGSSLVAFIDDDARSKPG